MGLFDNLLAPFSSQPQRDASQAQITALQNAQQTASPLLQSAYGALGQGYGTAQGNITGATGAALGNITGARDTALGDISGNYAQGLQPLQQNYAGATAGANQLAGLLGIGGSGDPAQIQSMLAATPGYQFTLNQGTQQVGRDQAMQGALQSGNTDKAIADYTTGLANQTYQNAVGNLQPYLGYQSNAGNALANEWNQLGTSLANINTGAGNTMAGINTGAGQSLANLNTGLATGLAGNLGQQANLGYGTDVAAGNASANAALAPQTAGTNAWGAIGNLGGSLLKLASAPATGGGSLAGNAAQSLFGNIFSPKQQQTNA